MHDTEAMEVIFPELNPAETWWACGCQPESQHSPTAASQPQVTSRRFMRGPYANKVPEGRKVRRRERLGEPVRRHLRRKRVV